MGTRLQWLAALLCAAGAAAAAADSGGSGGSSSVRGFDLQGRISTAADGLTPVPLPPGTAIEVVLTTAGGVQTRTFAARDGSFTLRGVPPGSHIISPYHMRFVYPEVRVEVAGDGKLAGASLVFNGHPLPSSPLVIPPAGVAQYYDVRRPVDIVAWIKTPYGLMLAFSVFAMVVMPYMKVDPEEYRATMAELRGDRPDAAAGGGQQRLPLPPGVQRRQQQVQRR